MHIICEYIYVTSHVTHTHIHINIHTHTHTHLHTHTHTLAHTLAHMTALEANGMSVVRHVYTEYHIIHMRI